MPTKFSELRVANTISNSAYLIGYDPNHTGEGSKNFQVAQQTAVDAAVTAATSAATTTANTVATTTATSVANTVAAATATTVATNLIANAALGSGSATTGVTRSEFLDLIELLTNTNNTITSGETYYADTFATSNGINLPLSTRAIYDSLNKKFTPTTADNSAILHFDGVQGATTTTDVNGHAVTMFQNSNIARIDTGQSKFGGSSLLLTSGVSSGAYVGITSSADFGVGTGDFTVEFFIYNVSSPGGYGNLFDTRSTSVSGGYGLGFNNSTGLLNFEHTSVGGSLAFQVTSAASITGGTTWRHIAAVRYNGVVTLYVNGVSQGSSPNTFDYGTSSPIWIGTRYGSGNSNFTGYMDAFRFCKAAKYTTNFTPPTTPIAPEIPNSAYTVVSKPWTVNTVPSKIGLRVLARTLSTVTEAAFVPNTDLVFSVSRDGGTTFTQVSLTATYTKVDGSILYTVPATSVTAQPSGKALVYKYVTSSNKSIEVQQVTMFVE